MCDNCGAKTASSDPYLRTFGNRVLLKHCGRCHSASYCSRICQREHWVSVHRHACKGRESAWIESLRSEIALRRQHVQAATRMVLDASSGGECTVLQTALADPSNCELAVQVMEMFPTSVDVQWRIAQQLGTVYRHKLANPDEDEIRGAKRANKAGMVAVLMKAMATHVLERNVLIPVSNMLGSLCLSYRQNIAAIIKVDGVRVVTKAMVQHKTDAAVIAAIIPIISQLMCEDDHMFAIGGEAGAVDTIVDALRMHMSEANGWGCSRVIHRVFSALRFVTDLGRFESNVHIALSLGAISVILKIMGAGDLCVASHAEACVLLFELLSFGIPRPAAPVTRATAADQFIKARGVQCITRTASRYVSSACIQEFSSIIIAKISRYSLPQQNLMRAKRSGVVQMVLTAMREHRDNVRVQLTSVSILNDLICPSAVEALGVAREGGAEFLVRVARRLLVATPHADDRRSICEVCDNVIELLQ